MDPHLLAHVLSQTFLPDADLRKRAEHELFRYESLSGYPSTLLHIVVLPDAQLPFTIKQAAILRLKHFVERHWDIASSLLKAQNASDSFDPSTYHNPLTPSDRQFVRDHLLEAVVAQHSSPLIHVQLIECSKTIIKSDWPHDWPHLLPSILAALQSPDPPRVYAGLLLLSALYKRWTFVEPKRRDEPVDALTRSAFPALLSIFQRLSSVDSLESYEMIRVLCRLFFLATQMRISPYLRSQANVLPFLTLLVQTVTRPLPPHLLTAFTQSTHLPPASHPLWKAKRWAMNALVRVFGRWGQPLSVKEKAMKPFATMFSSKVALPTFTALIDVLKANRDGTWVAPRVLQLCYLYLSNALKLQSLRKMMQQNLQFLVEHAILPVLCLTAEDVALFENDPHEFIRQSLDLMEEYHDPRVAACNFLIDLVKLDVRRQSNEALQCALALIDRIFKLPSPAPAEGVVLKEGAMRMLGALRKVLMDDKYHRVVESFLSTAVIPELQSPHGFQRSRAIHLLGRYSKLEWQAKDKQAEAIVLVCANLQAPNALPTRLEAAAAISRLVRDEQVLDFLRPQIPLIFSTFFDLMDEIGNEEVISTLQALLGQIGDDVEPFAHEVLTRLTTMAMTLMQAPEDDDEARLSASEALRTISAVFYALGPKPDVIKAVEPLTHPLIERVVLTEDGVEDFEDGLELIHCIIDHSSHVSPFMWRAFPRILASHSSYASDNLQQIAAVIDLFTRLWWGIFHGQQPHCTGQRGGG